MIRLFAYVVAAIVLATLLAMQASAFVFAKVSPSHTLQVMPIGNEGANRIILAAFQTEVKQEDDLPLVAKRYNALARQSFEKAPMGPEAHVVMALNMQDLAQRRQMLTYASSLNRRNNLLQSMVLQDAIARNDFPATATVLDGMLRVNPQQQEALFPILLNGLNDARTIPALARILNGSAPWQDRFLVYAAQVSQKPENVLQLRTAIDRQVPKFDPSLVKNLVAHGQYDLAYGLYQDSLTQQREDGTAPQANVRWPTQLPPFDWQLTEKSGFRANTVDDGEAVEIFVRGGKSGLLMRRLVKTPGAPFTVSVVQRIKPSEQLRDVRLVLRCAGTREPFYDERFDTEGTDFEVASVPSNCSFLDMAIEARAWSGRSPLIGTVESVTIK